MHASDHGADHVRYGAAKHGTAIFTAVLGARTGNPWMPPIPQYA